MTLWTPPEDSTNCWHLKSSSWGMLSLRGKNISWVIKSRPFRNDTSRMDDDSEISNSKRRNSECRMNLVILTRQTYTWPSSWAMVKAALSPLSWTMEHELEMSHMVPSSARPRVSHLSICGFRQMFSLPIGISLITFQVNRQKKGRKDLPSEQESGVVMGSARVIGVVEAALPLAEIAQHFRRGFARPVVQHFMRFPTVGRVVAGRRQYKFLVLEQQHANDGYLHEVAQTDVLVDQRHLRLRQAIRAKCSS